MPSMLFKVKSSITHFFDDHMQRFCAYADKYVFSKINIPWPHKYRWEKRPYFPSEQTCKNCGIEYGVEQPGAFQLVLYDKGKPVYASACLLYGKYYKEEPVQRTYDTFFKVMDNYIESHKIFSMFQWYLKHTTYIGILQSKS